VVGKAQSAHKIAPKPHAPALASQHLMAEVQQMVYRAAAQLQHATKTFNHKAGHAMVAARMDAKRKVDSLHHEDGYQKFLTREEHVASEDEFLEIPASGAAPDASVHKAQTAESNATAPAHPSGHATCTHYINGARDPFAKNQISACSTGNSHQCVTSELFGDVTSQCDVSKLCTGGSGGLYKIPDGHCGVLPTGQKIYCSATSPSGGQIPDDVYCPKVIIRFRSEEERGGAAPPSYFDKSERYTAQGLANAKAAVRHLHESLRTSFNATLNHSYVEMHMAQGEAVAAAQRVQRTLQKEEDRILNRVKTLVAHTKEMRSKHAVRQVTEYGIGRMKKAQAKMVQAEKVHAKVQAKTVQAKKVQAEKAQAEKAKAEKAQAEKTQAEKAQTAKAPLQAERKASAERQRAVKAAQAAHISEDGPPPVQGSVKPAAKKNVPLEDILGLHPPDMQTPIRVNDYASTRAVAALHTETVPMDTDARAAIGESLERPVPEATSPGYSPACVSPFGLCPDGSCSVACGNGEGRFNAFLRGEYNTKK